MSDSVARLAPMPIPDQRGCPMIIKLTLAAAMFSAFGASAYAAFCALCP